MGQSAGRRSNPAHQLGFGKLVQGEHRRFIRRTCRASRFLHLLPAAVRTLARVAHADIGLDGRADSRHGTIG